MPERGIKIEMANEDKRMMESAKKEEMLTCFRRISSKLEPAGMKGCGEEIGIATFGWPDDLDNAWSAS